MNVSLCCWRQHEGVNAKQPPPRREGISLIYDRLHPCESAVRYDDLLQRMAAGGGASDVDEQPRRRGRRESTATDRLWRFRPRCAKLERISCDRSRIAYSRK